MSSIYLIEELKHLQVSKMKIHLSQRVYGKLKMPPFSDKKLNSTQLGKRLDFNSLKLIREVLDNQDRLLSRVSNVFLV